MPSVASAAFILSTDFSGSSEAGTTLNNISWTSSGITAPGSSLSVTNGIISPGNTTITPAGDLWTTAETNGYFAPHNNTGSGGDWNTQINFTTLSSGIALGDLDLLWTNVNNQGVIQPAARDNTFQVQLIDIDNANNVIYDSGAIDTPAVNTASEGSQTLTFDLSSLTLDANTNYGLYIAALDAPIAGSHTAIDSLTLNGAVVPEPSSALLVGLAGGLSLLRRKRA